MTYIFKDKYIWITGASSGIGLELANLLLQRGANVLAGVRNKSALLKLHKLYPNNLRIEYLDLTNHENIQSFKQVIENFSKHLDTVILNAGDCYYVDLPKYNSEIIKKNFTVNFFALSSCIEIALPFLRESTDPYLVGMTSSAAYVGLPRAEGYGSAKSAARYLLQSLQADLYNEGIKVSIICPGFIKTPLTDKNDFPMPWLMPINQAAKKILQGMEKQKTEIKFPWQLIMLFKFIRFLPDKLRIKILAKSLDRS